MALFASWSPGTAFMPAEFPSDMVQVNGVGWSDVLGLRQSGGTTFQGKVGTSNWFHVPIATPVIINDVRVKLQQVFVMFQCGSVAAVTNNNALLAGCNVTDVHVWDGPNRIHMFGPFNLFGEHRFRFATSNVFKLPTPLDIFFGLELAVHVSFSQNESVTFASAGADFQA
ncbi:MAG TPA: hypothetical protein VE195_10225 [Acidobacteriaceae bacterium]|nr:hypothetical protein [Acidobacteriaceae bacterium]